MRLWLLLALLWPLAASAQAPAARVIAVTFDDLPFAGLSDEDGPALERMTERLLTQLQAEQVPAIGFVNEARLHRGGLLDPARVALLRRWLEAGFELGNHTHSHLSLNRTPLDVFQADVLRGETVTRPLMQGEGRTLLWFRHPFLHLGRTAEVRTAFDRFLATHGYLVAPVTVNSPEWAFAAAYARAQAQDDPHAAQRIVKAYVPYMDTVLARAEVLALDLFGRPIPHVLLLHANALNADHFGALAAMLRQRGYRFVSLDEALTDRVYATPLGPARIEGESWLEGWARQAGLRPSKAPAVPGFVRQWAGAAAYRGE